MLCIITEHITEIYIVARRSLVSTVTLVKHAPSVTSLNTMLNRWKSVAKTDG